MDGWRDSEYCKRPGFTDVCNGGWVNRRMNIRMDSSGNYECVWVKDLINEWVGGFIDVDGCSLNRWGEESDSWMDI